MRTLGVNEIEDLLRLAGFLSFGIAFCLIALPAANRTWWWRLSPVLTLGPFLASVVAVLLVIPFTYAHYALGDDIGMQLAGCLLGSSLVCSGDMALEIIEAAADSGRGADRKRD